EGQFDAQSLGGKVVGQVLRRAASVGSEAAVIAGVLAEDPPVQGVGLANLAGSVEASLAEPEHWLRRAGQHVAASRF
ncbi:glycerate kinase, partial [Demequina sp.]|uniref:glycerate kinase n=1 Tax=Demequina sp. TaxID=2050685 RepID=UPI0025BFDFDC